MVVAHVPLLCNFQEVLGSASAWQAKPAKLRTALMKILAPATPRMSQQPLNCISHCDCFGRTEESTSVAAQTRAVAQPRLLRSPASLRLQLEAVSGWVRFLFQLACFRIARFVHPPDYPS